MAGGKSSAPVAKAEPAVFKWTPASPVKWTRTLQLTIEQKVALKPEVKDFVPYLMIYEADKSDWEKKSLEEDKKLQPVLAIHGAFDDEGNFSVSKIIPMLEPDYSCMFELKITGVSGSSLQLKDKDGKDIAKLEVNLPRIDADDTWQLDLALRSSKKYERCQDRVVLTVELPELLKKPANYKDDRFGPDSNEDKYKKFIQPGARKSFDYLYIHSCCAAGKPLATWLDYPNVLETLLEYKCGPHFFIDREGYIHHVLRNALCAKHAGDVDSSRARGNQASLGIEMLGLLDDLSIALMLCRELVALAKKPPSPSAGSTTPKTTKALKDIVGFLCHESKKKKKYTSRTGKMIDAMASKYKDADFSGLTEIWIPPDRNSWPKALGYYGVPGEAANASIQALYWNALKSTAAGDTYPLKVANKKSVKVTSGTCKCVASKGVDLDAKAEDITLCRMAKDEELPCEIDGGNIYADVPVADITQYVNDLLEGALKVSEKRKPDIEKLEILMALSDENYKRLLGYTEAQYASLADLAQALQRIYRFKRILSHHYAAKKRKRDPGGYFDWDKFLSHEYLADVRMLNKFKWEPTDPKRKPLGFAERNDAGVWGG